MYAVQKVMYCNSHYDCLCTYSRYLPNTYLCIYLYSIVVPLPTYIVNPFARLGTYYLHSRICIEKNIYAMVRVYVDTG